MHNAPPKRLSEAVIRGFGRIMPNSDTFLFWDDRISTIPCGCALGAALITMLGNDKAKAAADRYYRVFGCAPRPWHSASRITRELQVHFPWFTSHHEFCISNWFVLYQNGAITFNELITRIRDIEEPYMMEEASEASRREGAETREVIHTQDTQDQSNLITA